jgi:hypothetical protein
MVNGLNLNLDLFFNQTSCAKGYSEIDYTHHLGLNLNYDQRFSRKREFLIDKGYVGKIIQLSLLK